MVSRLLRYFGWVPSEELVRALTSTSVLRFQLTEVRRELEEEREISRGLRFQLTVQGMKAADAIDAGYRMGVNTMRGE